MENTIYVSSAYLAPVEYYTKLFACEKIYVEQYDNYVKQTYRNRCVIAAADGPLALTSTSFMKRNMSSCGIIIKRFVP